MTSLKRAFVAERECSDSSLLLPCISSSQRSRIDSPDQISQEASYRDRGWGQLRRELIGLPLLEDAGHYLALDGNRYVETDLRVTSTLEAEMNIESWMTEEVRRDCDASNIQTNHEAVQDQVNGSDFSVCYGMVSSMKTGRTVYHLSLRGPIAKLAWKISRSIALDASYVVTWLKSRGACKDQVCLACGRIFS